MRWRWAKVSVHTDIEYRMRRVIHPACLHAAAVHDYLRCQPAQTALFNAAALAVTWLWRLARIVPSLRRAVNLTKFRTLSGSRTDWRSAVVYHGAVMFLCAGVDARRGAGHRSGVEGEGKCNCEDVNRQTLIVHEAGTNCWIFEHSRSRIRNSWRMLRFWSLMRRQCW